MAQTNTIGTPSVADGKFKSLLTINGTATAQAVGELATAGTYVDKNIEIDVTVPAGALTAANGGKVTATAGLADTTYLTTTATGNYGPITATADASAANSSIKVGTSGWLDKDASATVTGQTATQASVTKYVKAGVLQAGAGNAPVATAGLADTTYLTTTNTGYAITATADAAATSKTSVDVVKTAGWVPADGSITITTPAATQASTTKYIKAGALKAGAGSAGATGTNIAITAESSQPTSGAYITVTGSGSTGVQTAGWIPTTATQSSNTATKYYSVAAATLKNTATSGKTYTEIDAASNENVIIPSGGYLYIDGGAIGNTKISLATLVPDGATIAETATGESNLMRGISAYDKDGKLIAGTMPDAALSSSASVTAVSVGTKASGKYPVSVTGSSSAGTTTTGYAVAGTTSKTGTVSSSAKLNVIELDASASVTAVTPSYNTTSEKFDVVVTGTSSASVTSDGYGKKGVETGSGSVTSSATLDKVTVGASFTAGTDGTVTPVISNKSATVSGKEQIAAAPATATTEIDKYYMAVNTAAIPASTTVTSKVTAAGYGTTSYYTSAGDVTVTRGAAASGTYYIPVKSGSHTLSGGSDAKVTPVISNVTASVTGKTQVAATPTTATTGITKYYIAVNTAAKTTTSTVTCKTAEGWIPTDTTGTSKTVTGGANASGTYYVPLPTSSHGIESNGNATITAATLTNTQGATGTIGSTAITPVTYTTSTDVGANYVKVTSTAAQSSSGSISIPVKCVSTAGYTEGETKTYSATGNVGVTSKTSDIYFKVYNGEIVTA